MDLNGNHLDLTGIDDVEISAGGPVTGLTLESLGAANGIDEMAASCAPTCSCCAVCCCCCPK